MKKNKTLLFILIAVIAVLLVGGVVWGKSYYESRYAGTDYYTMIPLDENMDTVMIYSASGEEVGMGKDYQITGYDAEGNSKFLEWTMMTDKGELFKPGTFLRVSASSEIVLSETIISKEQVPKNLLPLVMAE